MGIEKKHGTSHKLLLNRINRVKGQINGILSMVEKEKYCIEILTQIKAARSALKSLELEVIQGHLNHCVKAAIESGSQRETNKKIREIMDLFQKSSKS